MPSKDGDPTGRRLLIRIERGRPRLYWMRNVYVCPSVTRAEIGGHVIVQANPDDTRWLDVYLASDRTFLGRFYRQGRTHRPSA